MKIRGPDGTEPGGTVSGEGVDGEQGVDGAEFKELLAPETAGGAEGGAPVSAVAQLRAELAAGAVDVEQAAERLVEGVVQRYAAALGPQRTEALRRLLRRTLEEDPMLREKLEQARGG